MPGIVALVSQISMAVSASLVNAGYTLPAEYYLSSIAIANVTGSGVNVVITTATPHGLSPRPTTGLPYTGVVSGVLGNTAANNIDSSDVLDSGYPNGVAFQVVDAYTLSAYRVDPSLGTIVPIVGNGAYAGGGTIQFALADGSILLGREFVQAHGVAPRIVFIPTRSSFGPKSPSNRRNTASAQEIARQSVTRSIATESIDFEVHVWGQSNPPDPAGDFDATQVLYQAIIQQVHSIAAGCHEWGNGIWTDQTTSATQMIRAGHEMVFGVTIRTPVLDFPTPFVPSGTTAQFTIQLQPADGTAPETIEVIS